MIKTEIAISNKTKSRINARLVRTVAEKFTAAFASEIKRKAKKKNIAVIEASIVFAGDARMRRLNKIYRGKDKTTDILSFPEEPFGADEPGRVFLGEIILSYAQIKRQAKEYSPSAKDELVFILVHGLLHLLGREDGTAAGKEKMDKLGREFCKKL